MKTKFFGLLVVLLVSITSLFAQDEVFKVLASKGANKVVSSTGEQKILIGKKLHATDKIIIGENSYLGLAHKTGKTIELKKAGTYEVSKLSGEVATQNAGVAKKYVDYVAGEMASQDEDMAKNRHKYMQVTGSVERGDVAMVTLLAPKKAYTLSAPVVLRWTPVENAKSYKINLTNMADESVYSVETSDSYVVVDMNKVNIQSEKNLLWKVAVNELKNQEKPKKKIESETYMLNYVEDDKAANLEKQATEIKAELNEETALNKFVLANFYEENGLIIDAIANYQAAMALEPEVEEYKLAYGKCLAKNQIVEKK